MAEHFTDDQVVEFKKVFRAFDKDSNDKICCKELADVMKTMGFIPTEKEIQDMMKTIDLNENGTMEFNEFLHLMFRKQKKYEADMQEAFRVFDKDGNGFISTSELQSVMASIGSMITEEKAEAMIKVVDVDGDGQVNYQEFIDHGGFKMK